MPVTVTVDSNFIYAMLKEYNDAVLAKNIGGITLSSINLAVLQDNTTRAEISLSCSVSAVSGGAKIVCFRQDASLNNYTANGAVYRFRRTIDNTTYTYELYKVSFSAVTKGTYDILDVTATAVLTVG